MGVHIDRTRKPSIVRGVGGNVVLSPSRPGPEGPQGPPGEAGGVPPTRSFGGLTLDADRTPQQVVDALADPLNAAIAEQLAADGTVFDAAVVALNDALEAGAGTDPTTTTRTNLALNPTGANAGGWTTSTSLYGTRSTDATVTRRTGASSQKVTRTATTPSNNLAAVSYLGQTTGSIAAALPVTAGEQYTFSVYAACEVVSRARMNVTFYDNANAAVRSAYTGSFVDLVAGGATPAAGSFGRAVLTVTAPAGAVKAVAMLQNFLPTGQTSAGGEDTWVQDFLLEQAGAAGAYFDGDFTDTGDTVYAWTGTANASASTEAVTVPGVVGLEVEPPQSGADVRDRVLKEWAHAEAWEPLVVTRDAEGVVSTATVKWPDGSGGTFTATTVTDTIDAFEITHTTSGKKVVQAAVTRNADGAVTSKPALTVGAI